MPSTTLFSTFYSFKGGVGRTLTLANTAVELTERGYSVIIWDMDLEAPGIQHIPYFEKLTGKIKGGVVDITLQFIENDCKEINDKTFSDSIVTHPDNPHLRLLPVGNLDNEKDYSRKFSAIRWDKLFGVGKTSGFQLFNSIRQGLLNYRPDFVLIDSRTGYTDTGGVCCFKLPDVVFLMFNYGNQNLKGIRNIHNALTHREWLHSLREGWPLKTYLAASMIPTDRPDLRKVRKSRWMENREPDFTIHVEIPYNAEMAFNETVWAAEYPDNDFRRHYGEMLNILVDERNNLLPTPEEKETVPRKHDGKTKYGDLPYDPDLDPAKQFEEDTAHLFRLMGYEAEVNKFMAGSQVDVFLTHKTPVETTLYMVECKHWEKNVDKKIVDEVENNRKAAEREFPGCRAIIVAKKGFTKEAKTYAQNLNVTLKTYDELLNGIINFDRYVSYVKTLYAGTELEKNYIPQDVVVENTGSARPLLEYADGWLAETQGGFFTLLGDFGTGKTSFTKRLAHDLAIRYEKDKTAERIPVLINLKDVSKALSLENIVFEHFSKSVKLNVSPEAFLHLLKEGKLLLILDGFDEMATQSNKALTMKNFLELNRAFAGRAKVLLTCRTHYFKDRAETEETVKAEKKGLTEPATELYRAIQGKQGYSVGYLQEFDRARVEAYLKKTLPETWEEAQGFIDGVYNLKDLASRPVLLDMMVKSLPAIRGRDGDIWAADLYAAYVQTWVDRDDWRHELTREGREFLVEEMALRLWEEESDRVHYSRINDLLRDYLKDKKTVVSVTDVELASSEVRTASFLTRDDEGNYGFAHRSFMEYFLARGLARKTEGKDMTCLDIKRLSKEVILFLGRMVGIEKLVTVCGGVLAEPYRKRVSENSLFCLYWGPRYLLSPDGAMKDPGKLKELFSQKRPGKINLRGADLEGAELSMVDLSGADLETANMKGAVLTGASLEGARLKGADFSFALLDEAALAKADARQVIAHHVSFKKAVMTEADFSDADLHACTFLDADMSGARFDGSNLSYSGLLRAKININKEFSTANIYAIGMPGTGLLELQQAFQLGHMNCVVSATFSPDGTTIASASSDKKIILWDVTNGRIIRTLKGHSANVNSVRFIANGNTILSASSDNTIKIWDAAIGKEIQTLTGHLASVNAAVSSPDGTIIVSTSHDNTLKLWDAANGKEINTLTGHSGPVFSAAFSPDGTSIVSVSSDKTLKLWDMTNLKGIITLKGHSGNVLSATYSPDGTSIVSTSDDKTLKLWDVAKGKVIRTFKGHSGPIGSAAFSPGGDVIVSASYDGTLKLWDIASGTEIRTLKGHRSFVNSVAFSPDGSLIVSASHDGTLILWSTSSGEAMRIFNGHFGPIVYPSFSISGNIIMSVSLDNFLKIWDVISGSEKCTLKMPLFFSPFNICFPAFSPDGTSILSESDNYVLKLWDINSGKEVRTFKGHSLFIKSVAFSPDGTTIVSASADNTLKLWDVHSGREKKTLTGHSDSALSATFFPSGATILSASFDHTLKFWDVASGRAIKTLTGHTGPVLSATFSPDGSIIVSASYDDTLKLWDSETGEEIRTLKGHSQKVSSASFSPDGGFIVSASDDGTVRFWDAETGKETAVLKDLGIARWAAFSSDGKHLYIATHKGMLLVKIRYKKKTVESLDILGTFYHLPGNEWLAVGADNRFACSEGGRDYLYFADQLALYAASDLPELESPDGIFVKPGEKR